jgi:carbon monoxide dehydrogenase subunit G
VKLRNEFMIDAPAELAWPVLLDIPRVASCLPGATIEPGGDDGVFRGSMKVKLGPLSSNYKGTARLEEVDEDTRTASIAVQAREQNGQGTASAVITNRLEAVDGKTRVVAETDVVISGRQAQFGRGIMQDVAGRMLDDFATRFERELLNPAGNAQPAGDSALTDGSRGGPPREPTPAAPPAEAIDLGGLLPRPPLAGVVGAAAAAAGVAVVLLARRRRRGLSLEIKWLF